MTHVSASQIQLYRDCPTKWHRQYRLGIKSPPSPGQILGSAVHAALEQYLLEGKIGEDAPERARDIALSGIHQLPSRMQRLCEESVEHPVNLTSTPVPLKGFIDLWYRHEDGRQAILDHKTSSNPRWAKTPTELLHNVQMITYAHYVFEVLPDIDELWVQHAYYGTKSRWSKLVSALMTREWVARVWVGIESTINEMVSFFHAPPENVPKNFGACSMYGGCFHHTACHKESDTMTDPDLFAKLGLTPPDKKEDATVDEPAPEEVTTGVLLGGVNPPESTIHTPDVSNLGETDPPHDTETVEEVAGDGVKKRIKRVRHPETKELITKEERDQEFEKVDGKWVRRHDKPLNIQTVDANPSLESGSPAPTPQGGPQKPVDWTVSVTDEDVFTCATGLKLLCIGCLPLKMGNGWVLKPLDEIIAPYAQELCLNAGVIHVSLIRYGAGYDSVAGAVANAGWPEGVNVLYVDPMTKGSDRIIPILTTLADVVLRKTS